jgi:hypothetical protein
VTDQLPVPDSVLDDLRAQLVDRHQELVRYGLVVWTAGNVSARVPDLLCIGAIGPSGRRGRGFKSRHPDQADALTCGYAVRASTFMVGELVHPSNTSRFRPKLG